MSSFSQLFGASASKVDDKVSGLFTKKSDGPVTRENLKLTRTVIEIPEPLPLQEDGQEQVAEAEAEAEAEADEADEADEDQGVEDSDSEAEVEVSSKKLKKQKKKQDINEDLEANYYNKILKDDKKDDIEDNGSEKEDVEMKDVSSNDGKSKKAKTIDLKEQEWEKAERTVFVGNVPAAIIKSKSLTKQFKRFFAEIGKIDSIRFRSISFTDVGSRKVAFVKKALHESRESVNAYVVYQDKESSLKSVKELNGKIFENHHLKVDHLSHPTVKDNKRTIFVGNLDFGEQEENLWKYFNTKINNDVESVRIIRDSKTNMGKGFALIQFKDTLSVNKALLLNDKPISYGESKKIGRKLRISRASKYAKPSIMSPNHIENVKPHRNHSKLITDQQKTKMGRAQAILGKADKSSIGKVKVIEGTRASKGSKIAGIKGLKSAKGKVKKPRLRDRSTNFKKDQKQMQKEYNKK
jgi:nucleolar protein 12